MCEKALKSEKWKEEVEEEKEIQEFNIDDKTLKIITTFGYPDEYIWESL